MRRFLLCSLAVLSTCWLEVHADDSDSGSIFNFKANRLKFLTALYQGDIEFYGQLVDQHGKSLPNASVGAEVMQWGNSGQRLERFKTTTDHVGRFTFKADNGSDLFLKLNELGPDYYYSPQDQGAYNYSPMASPDRRHRPQSDKPEVVEVWRRLGPEPLVVMDECRNLMRIEHHEAATMAVDLVEFKKDLAGDLLVQVTYGPEASVQDREYSWKVKYTLRSGGLMRVGRLRYPFLAPETGYQTTFEYEQKVPDPSEPRGLWYDNFGDYFYVKSHEGKLYGYLKLEVTVSKSQLNEEGRPYAWFRVAGVINPQGSRNLENLYLDTRRGPAHLRER
jgi:hypothetical protein